MRFSKLQRRASAVALWDEGFDAQGSHFPARRPRAHLLARIALCTAALFVLIWGGLGVVAWRTYHAGKYPNATTVDTSDVWRASPSPFFKRVESYRSPDPFNLIYNWYSRQFDLGPERFANGNCLLMARSSTLFGPLNLNASVMVCNTAADRMMFVTRTYSVRYPDWLRRLL